MSVLSVQLHMAGGMRTWDPLEMKMKQGNILFTDIQHILFIDKRLQSYIYIYFFISYIEYLFQSYC